LEDFLSHSFGFLLLNVLALILYRAFLPILSISTTEDETMTSPPVDFSVRRVEKGERERILDLHGSLFIALTAAIMLDPLIIY